MRFCVLNSPASFKSNIFRKRKQENRMKFKLSSTSKRLFRNAECPEIRFVRIHPSATEPRRATRDAAGYDLTSAESCAISPGARRLVHTGISVRIPRHYHIEIRPRSGLALRCGITVLNAPGTVDADYRGELMVVLHNAGEEVFRIAPGDRIAQAVVIRHARPRWREVADIDCLGQSERGCKGFGSTGLK